MPDEEIIENKEELENAEDNQEESETLTNSGDEEEVDGEAIVKKHMAEAGIIESEDEEGEDIPDEFTNACLAQGWTEDEIRDFATDLDDDILLAMIPDLIDESEEDSKKQTDTDKKGSKEEPKKKSEKAVEPQNEELAALRKEINELKKQNEEAKKFKGEQESAAMVRAIDQAFDEVDEDFVEIFGKSDELLTYPAGPYKGQRVPTSPEMIARKEVVAIAAPFIADGLPIKEAMEIGFNWFKGKNLEVDVKRNVIKDLKKHESKLSAKRSGKETVKHYEDEDEEHADVVREAARKAGIDEGYFDN